MEGNQAIHKFRHELITTLQRDAAGVNRKPVKRRTIQAGKRFETIEGVLLIKHLGVALQSMRGH